MTFLPGFKLHAVKETLNLPDFEDFLKTLQISIEELSRKTPLDGSLTVNVDRFGAGYKVAIRLASRALNFFEVEDGRSPFVALEKALLKAGNTLKVWSINRRF